MPPAVMIYLSNEKKSELFILILYFPVYICSFLGSNTFTGGQFSHLVAVTRSSLIISVCIVQCAYFRGFA